MVENNEINCTIITYYDKTYELKIDKSFTFKILKQKLLEIDNSLSDIKLIYGGRIIRNDDALIYSYVNGNDCTFYINQAQVHGGCCPKYI